MIALNCSSFIAPAPWRSRERIPSPKYAPRCRMYVLAHAFRLSQITACDIAGDGDIIATPSVPGRSPPNGSERCMRGLMSLLPRQTLVLSVELSSSPRDRSCRNQFEGLGKNELPCRYSGCLQLQQCLSSTHWKIRAHGMFSRSQVYVHLHRYMAFCKARDRLASSRQLVHRCLSPLADSESK
jgi:hypothetical protein